jgi:site-specific DNA-cytosine methylase
MMFGKHHIIFSHNIAKHLENMGALLRTLDLFSGIGGMTYALKGLIDTVAYCDRAEESQEVIVKLMKRKMLHQAPICNDVLQLDANWLTSHTGSSHVDMIVGGFPCVGFSGLGLRKAFDNQESGLFSEILRLVDETKCSLIFLENVQNILNLGMDFIVQELTHKRGYELRWTITSAEYVGAPHQRARWFCLCVRPGFIYEWKKASHFTPFPWGSMKEPVRCDLGIDKAKGKKRRGMLGNSVVPDAVRYAFVYLVSRCTHVPVTLDTPSRWKLVTSYQPYSKQRQRKSDDIQSWPKHGILTVNGNIENIVVELTPFRKQHLKKLVFDPSCFKSTQAPSPLMRADLVTTPKVQYTWSTPRHGNVGMCNYLTERSIRDLDTQIRFERKTPKRLRKGPVNPVFVEYMMGYPPGWTQL